MAQKVAHHEAPKLVERSEENKRPYRKIRWENFTDGETWHLTRADDWADVKTALQVVEMAERYAKANGYKVHEHHNRDNVWIRFERLAQFDPFAP